MTPPGSKGAGLRCTQVEINESPSAPGSRQASSGPGAEAASELCFGRDGKCHPWRGTNEASNHTRLTGDGSARDGASGPSGLLSRTVSECRVLKHTQHGSLCRADAEDPGEGCGPPTRRAAGPQSTSGPSGATLVGSPKHATRSRPETSVKPPLPADGRSPHASLPALCVVMLGGLRCLLPS